MRVKRVSVLMPSLIVAVLSQGCSSGENPLPVESAAAPAQAQTSPERNEPKRVAIRHVLIAHKDAELRATLVGRSRETAKALASEIRQSILEGEDMAMLARKHSNDPSASRGGFLGASERGAWVEAFEDAAFGLEVDGVSKLVETDYGFHIIRREALQEVKLLHILVAHKDAKNVAKKRSVLRHRSKDEALEITQSAYQSLLEGASFTDLAEQLSDGPMGTRGADLGWFVRGELGPTFDESAFSLEIGEFSSVIESVFGYHLIQRVE